MEIRELLSIAISRNASDLHLVASYCPTVRINGELHPLVTLPKLDASDIESMVFSLLTPLQKELLIANKELDFSTVISTESGISVRFRVNSYYQKTMLSASFRLIPAKIKTLEELRLPPILREFTKLRQGLILVTGPTSSGKSTTLASMIQEINFASCVHIISIEDPIEYVFTGGKAIISQREMYQDTNSWRSGLKNVLREDPDVVYLGEIRDYETISSALTIAETGHLVFSTLHTNSSSQSIDRIIDIFPATQQAQVRMQLSMVIAGIISQRLIPTVEGYRVPACEIMIGSASIKNTIREGKTHLIDNIIQTSADVGMMLFEDNLKDLVEQNIISHEIALEYAIRPDTYIQITQR